MAFELGIDIGTISPVELGPNYIGASSHTYFRGIDHTGVSYDVGLNYIAASPPKSFYSGAVLERTVDKSLFFSRDGVKCFSKGAEEASLHTTILDPNDTGIDLSFINPGQPQQIIMNVH